MSSRISAVRYRIVLLLAVFSVVGYVLRMNMAVAAKFMMPDLGLTEVQMGQVFSAFMAGYAIFQAPWGMLGDRNGARKTLAGALFFCAACTVLTGLLSGLWPRGATAAFALLIVLRFLLGAGQAAIYPVAARAIAYWLPATERALGYSIIIAGAALGSAVTGPFVSWLMVVLSWRAAFYFTSTFALAIAAAWFFYARDQPSEHPQVSAQELATILEGRASPRDPALSASWR